MRNFLLSLFLFASFSLGSLFAQETFDRFVRLNINERNGSFSFFFLTDPQQEIYESLLSSHNPSTSFLEVIVNGTSFRPSRARGFQTRLERDGTNPVIIHESSFLEIRQTFSPIKTINSSTANGVKISVKVINKSAQDASIGLRFLLDTHLGEGRGGVPFATNNLIVNREILIETSSDEHFWVSRGSHLSLMGSIGTPYGYDGIDENVREPDFLHFANWKRLSDVPWKARRRDGRNFNLLPYSVGDSAVCYYYEPQTLGAGDYFTALVFLSTEDGEWYTPPPRIAPPPPPVIAEPVVPEQTIEKAAEILETVAEAVTAIEADDVAEDSDIQHLKHLQDILAQFVAGEITLDEHDLKEIEESIRGSW